jgi:leucyl-tRNA synthetase
MFTHADLARWLPVSQVVCGADQAGWWLNDRFFFKVLRDIGLLKHMPHAEPVRRLLMHEMVLADGRKMSKSLGNVVDPDEVISRWGADAARLAVLKVNPRKAFSWTDDSLQENHAFLSALWDFVDQIATDGGGGGGEPGQRRLERWSQAAQRKVAAAYERRAFHLVLRELKTLFQLIRRHRGDGGAAAPEAYRVAVRSLLDLLEPLAPHVSAELKGRLDCVGAPRTGSPSQVVRTSRMEPA